MYMLHTPVRSPGNYLCSFYKTIQTGSKYPKQNKWCALELFALNAPCKRTLKTPKIQWFCRSRYLGKVTPNIVYFYYKGTAFTGSKYLFTGPVLPFSKWNKIFDGYFDQENVLVDNENKYFSGITEISAEKEALHWTHRARNLPSSGLRARGIVRAPARWQQGRNNLHYLASRGV